MYRLILAPLDGSEFGEPALPMVLSLARQPGATLQIIHVHISFWDECGERGENYDETTERAMRERDRACLDSVVRRLAGVADLAPSRSVGMPRRSTPSCLS